MHAEIVMIGTELLLGQVIDTNAAVIGQTLAENGIPLYRKTTVGDNQERLLRVLDEALQRSDVVLCSGGLGPTEDDLTRECVAELLGRPLEPRDDLLRQLEERFEAIGRKMTANNLKQAMLPRGAQAIPNPHGTAPGLIVDDPGGIVICMPGVPSELGPMLTEQVLPYLRERFGIQGVIHSRVLKVCGMGESQVDQELAALIAASSNPTIGLLASPEHVRVRLTARAPSREEADALIVPLEQQVRQTLQGGVFGADEDTLESIVDALLGARGWTLAVAESWTGGMLARRLVSAGAGSFVGGVVAPGNAGRCQLDVAREILLHYNRATCALAVGAEAESGLGCVACITPTGDETWRLRRAETSELGQVRGAVGALEWFRRLLIRKEDDA
jgi:nicotinamide-nucleotide amidase